MNDAIPQIEDGMMNNMDFGVRVARKMMLLVLAASVLVLPTAVRAQQHGGQVQKSCTKIKRCAGRCSVSTTLFCGTSSLNCPPGETCVPGNVCNGVADCPGVQSFCVGGPTGGLIMCMAPLTMGCSAAAECSSCIPVEEANLGDTMSCEILVTNVDGFNDNLAITSLTDTVMHATPRIFNLLDPLVATLFGQCNTPPGKRCFSDLDCAPVVAGNCSLNRRCVNPSTFPPTIGVACTRSGDPICSASQICSVVIPKTPTTQPFFGAIHTDVVELLRATSPNFLRDNAEALGIDFGVRPPLNGFDLTFPGLIGVNQPAQCTGVGPCTIDIDGAPFCSQATGPCTVQAAVREVARTNTSSTAPTRTIAVHGVCVGDPVLVDGLFNLVITGDPPTTRPFNNCSGAKGPPPGTLNSTIARKAPPFITPSGSNGEVIKVRSSTRVTVKYLNIRDGRFPATGGEDVDDGIDFKSSKAGRLFCNCITNNEEAADSDGGSCNEFIQNTITANENGIRASGGAKNCRYKDNTVIDNTLPVSEPPSDPAGRNDGLIITESATGNNFEGNEVLNGAPDDGIALNVAKTNCIVNNKVDRCGGPPTPFNPDGTGACELISSTNNRIDCNVFTNCVNGTTPSNCCHASGSSTGNTGCNANFCPAMPVCTGTCAPCPPLFRSESATAPCTVEPIR